jgi:hypothetical protein
LKISVGIDRRLVGVKVPSWLMQDWEFSPFSECEFKEEAGVY